MSNSGPHPGAWIEGDPTDGFHTYGLNWTSDKLERFFDGKKVHETTQGVSTSDNQAVILSIENAVGGNNPWAPGTSNGGTAKMVVDYVRISDTQPPAMLSSR
jgi:beta-glucanase (GH16 family)